ncbi:MAG: hypothetical protein COB93_08965, partial [Sneathiella sp.]
MPDGLKLIATEAEELEILSAALEGTITSPGEMSFLRTDRAFTLTGSRFRWEKINNRSRVRSGVYFGDVIAVKSTGISQKAPTEMLELLTISVQSGEDAAAEISLNFAGSGTILLATECINVTLT